MAGNSATDINCLLLVADALHAAAPPLNTLDLGGLNPAPGHRAHALVLAGDGRRVVLGTSAVEKQFWCNIFMKPESSQWHCAIRKDNLNEIVTGKEYCVLARVCLCFVCARAHTCVHPCVRSCVLARTLNNDCVFYASVSLCWVSETGPVALAAGKGRPFHAARLLLFVFMLGHRSWSRSSPALVPVMGGEDPPRCFPSLLGGREQIKNSRNEKFK